MRIAILCETFPPEMNGVAHTMRQLLAHLRSAGEEAIVVAPSTAPAESEGFPIVRLAGAPLPFYREVRLTPPQPGILRALRKFEPDVLHAVGPAILGAVAPFLAARLGVPLVASYHTHFGDFARHYGLGFLERPVVGWLRRIHNRAAVTLCPSTDAIARLRATGFRRLQLWARGVDGERFHPRKRSEEWRRSIGVRAGEALVTYVGRLAPEKRIADVGDAVRGLPNTRLAIVGNGPARAALTRRFSDLPVVFTGALSGEMLATAYASADVFAFASDSDTFGQVVLEAMASGLPVVAARSGGAIDLVEPGGTGFLFTPGDVAELRARLAVLAGDPRLRARLGAAGRRVAERRSWPAVMDELLAIYRAAAVTAPVERRTMLPPRRAQAAITR